MPRYKHGKQTHPIDFEDFRKAMEIGVFVDRKELAHKSFLAFLYWFGVRKAEALERVLEDFQIKDGKLIVDAKPKKGGEREPLEISVQHPYVNLIVEQVNRTKPSERVWSFHPNTAINVVKRAMGDNYYPHFFRLNRATRFLDDPKTTLPEMKAWFGWKASKTVDPYIGYSRRHIKEMSAKLEQELE